MTDDEVLHEFRSVGALLEGHFKLSSGRHSAIYLLQALGLMRKLAGYNWAKVAMLVLLTVVIFPSVDARGIALCYLGTAFGGLVVIQYLARQALPTFSSRVFLDEVWRPLVATVTGGNSYQR